MNKKYLALISRIEDELIEIERISFRIQKAWANSQRENDDLYLDSVALNLHGFYSGLERIFELIAKNIDGTSPKSDSWHQDLLKQMMIEIKQVRPAIISKKTCDALDEYRGFRHIVRNVYTFNLSAKKLKPLVDDLETTFGEVRSEISLFINFIQEQISQ